MSIQELLESAQLDALGLLDEQDRDAFERAFAAAPAALQAQLRREQARLCHIDALLPEVELPDTLWPKVRDAVLEAQTAAASAATGDPVRAHAGSDRTARALPMVRSSGVSRLWRAAAIGFATAAVVLGGAVMHLRSTAERSATIGFEDVRLSALREEMGRKRYREQIFGESVGRFVMVDVKNDGRGHAAIYTSPEWATAVLYCETPVPEGHTLRLVELDANDEIGTVLSEFESNGSFKQIDVDLKQANPKRLALVSAPRGQAANKGQILLRMA